MVCCRMIRCDRPSRRRLSDFAAKRLYRTAQGFNPGRALTPLIYSHVTPYGTFRLDMNQRLAIEQDAVAA
jgi:hypothetical protein